VHKPNYLANIANKQVDFNICHKSVGHASVSKLKHIEVVPIPCEAKEVCLTCPMAKFAKLPYILSESYANTNVLNWCILIFWVHIEFLLMANANIFLPLLMIILELHGCICSN